MVKLLHLRYFVAVADAGTVSAAADAVHVTQPALSRQLRQLETDLGVGLFDRSAGRLSLNRTGSALLDQARELLEAAGALERVAAFHGRGGIERVRISAPTVTLTDVVAPFVATMAPDDPVVDVQSADGLDTRAMLRAGADVAIGTQRPQRPFRSAALAVLPVWAYVPIGDPWSSRDTVPVEELIERDLIVLPSTFTARQALDAALFSSAVSTSSMVEAASGTIAQALAATGRGVAVVSDDPRFDLVPIRVQAKRQPVSIKLVAAWDPRSVAALSLEALVGRLSAWVDRRYGRPS